MTRLSAKGPLFKSAPLSTLSVLWVASLTAGLLLSFFFGFDVMDEASTLYRLSHPSTASFFFINNLAGTVGAAFGNNIIVWRVLGLMLLLSSAAVFATGLERLVARLRGLAETRGPDLGLLAMVCTGALAAYSLGAPLFNYNLAAAAGMLGGLGGAFHALYAPKSGWLRYLWLSLSAFFWLMMLAARPTAGLACLLLAPQLWMVARQCVGTRAALGLTALLLAFGLAMGTVVTLGLGLYPQLLSVGRHLQLESMHGGHSARALWVSHARELGGVFVLCATLLLAAGAVAVVGAGLEQLWRQNSPHRSFRITLGRWLGGVAACGPLWILYDYGARLPALASMHLRAERFRHGGTSLPRGGSRAAGLPRLSSPPRGDARGRAARAGALADAAGGVDTGDLVHDEHRLDEP